MVQTGVGGPGEDGPPAWCTDRRGGVDQRSPLFVLSCHVLKRETDRGAPPKESPNPISVW